MGFFNRIFRRDTSSKKEETPGDNGMATANSSEAVKPTSEASQHKDEITDNGVKRIKLELNSTKGSSPYEQGITLKAILQDKMFSKDNPIEFEAFLNELKVRDPELFKQRFGDGNDDWKILNNIYPLVKNREELKSLIEWVDGQIKPGSAMDGLVVVELFDDILLTFGLDSVGATYERLKISYFHDFEKVGLTNIVNHAYLNFERKIKDTLSMDLYPSGVGMLIFGGGYESSMIIDERVWSQIHTALHASDVVFSIPTRDVFIFCDKNDCEAIELLKVNTYQTFMNPAIPGKISSKLFLRDISGKTTVYAMDYFPIPGQ
ncbi:MAG TPA: hypothetical protein PKA12_02865 [Saprospiraceae bacterium]|mgnify:FL=1|nr:hypothetical protein [Saprospiraceae bacterium]